MCAPAWWCQLMVPHIFLTASDGCGRTREEHLGMLTSVGRTKHQTLNTDNQTPKNKKQIPNAENQTHKKKAKKQNNNANTNHNQILIVLAFSECFPETSPHTHVHQINQYCPCHLQVDLHKRDTCASDPGRRPLQIRTMQSCSLNYQAFQVHTTFNNLLSTCASKSFSVSSVN